MGQRERERDLGRGDRNCRGSRAIEEGRVNQRKTRKILGESRTSYER